MKKEVISDKQAISIIILFMSGTSTVLMVALSAEGDFWLAIILALAIALFTAFVFGHLHEVFPNKNFFDMCQLCFGKFIGKLICILYIYWTFEEATLVLINAKQFITETTIPETPQTIAIIPIAILCAWAVKAGIEVIGKWSEFVVMIFISVILIMGMLLIPQMSFDNFEPILFKGIKPVIKGTFSAFAFPFGEIVMLAMVFQNFTNKKSAYKVYMRGLFISGIIALITSITTILILGIDIATASYFPVFNAASGINVGNFIQRLEILAALIGVIGAFLKNTILVLAICKGVSTIFNLTNYRLIILPISLLIINYSNILVKSRMGFVEFNGEIWSYYAVLLELFIPVIMLMICTIKRRSMRSIRKK
ncbi:GerAB/ArcD/ProY family transporter [Crassaminicella profunda]|uniref:GerAB/ArcD/ProY family transporter n=1 Tax=Crassaminicella profunda TaxID=1286698 RepID=UPI001CA748FE|nr:endospore germination permease [Crassaminicella profunda]QZY54557.1 endospore germination permease [Crassaminicella profunda]